MTTEHENEHDQIEELSFNIANDESQYEDDYNADEDELLNEGTEEKKPKRGDWYVPDSDMMEELKKSHQQNQMTNGLYEMCMKIALGLSSKLPYKDPELKRDVIHYAIMICAKNWRSYDMERKTKPFSYFYSVVNNGLKQGWNSYYKSPSGHTHISIDKLIKSVNED